MSGTETFDPRYRLLDTWSDAEILAALWDGQERAVAAVRPALPAIAAAASAMAERLRDRGRIVYAGAGSAGRQAALDGMELGATFGWPPERIAFVLAEGGTLNPAARGDGEDDVAAAQAAVAQFALGPADVVVAVAASGTTPFTVAAAEAAREAGALIVAIANNSATPLLATADHPILLDSGAEVIAGSTRLNAGTAQKAALGLLSSLVMTRLGHVHDGLMVSMRSDCAKLADRAARIVAQIAGCPEGAARDALAAANGSIKAAVLVVKGASATEAWRILDDAGGNLRVALSRRSHATS
jgi:N-acetylmuramic acid 6-phosphate etherase